MTKVHEAAAVGFERAADAYERGRPEYSPEAVQFVRSQLFEFQNSRGGMNANSGGLTASPQGLHVADVAAGTGKFTRVLASFSIELVATIAAVEPVAAMRTKCADLTATSRVERSDLPATSREEKLKSPATSRVSVLDGTAESLPLADASMDVVTVAQAFHWFDGAVAVPEIHRVLKPGGMLLLIWNVRDESFAWIREMTELMVPYEGTAPRYRSMKWREAFDAEHAADRNSTHSNQHGRAKKMFSPLKLTSIKHLTIGTIDVMLDRVASVSFVASLPAADRAALLAKMRALYLRELAGGAGSAAAQETLAMPYEAQIFVARKQ